MKIDAFLDMARNMVVEYYNRYVKGDGEAITMDNTSFREITDDGEILGVAIVVNNDDSIQYIVNHNIGTNKTTSYLYKQLEEKVLCGAK